MAMATVQAREPEVGDAFGRALLDFLESGPEGWGHIIERDDGLVEFIDTAVFFDADAPWSAMESKVLPERAGPRVLDVGSGAGRNSLALQGRGHEVVALDVSPGALEVCRRRGVRETFLGTVFELAETETGRFNTFLLCGNNYGLFESAEHAPRFLRSLAELAAPGAEIVGTCLDPLDTTNPLHLAYHELNRDRGRLPGQLRLRSRWTNIATDWFDYLFVPVQELAALASEAGWRLVEHRHGPGPGPYLAILQLR